MTSDIGHQTYDRECCSLTTKLTNPCVLRNRNQDAMEDICMNARRGPMNKEQALELGSESKAEEDGGGLRVVLVTKKQGIRKT